MQTHDSTALPSLATVTNTQALTMSSREIAELTGKQHKNVKRDIETMLADLQEDVLRFERIYLDTMKREQKEYHLDRELTETLLTGYSAPLRRKVIARLRELEQAAKPVPLDFSNPAVVLGVISHLQETVTEQQGRLKKLDRLEGAKGSMCISDAAKTLDVKRNDLFTFMATRRWIFKRTGSKAWLAYDTVRHAGLMEHDDHMYMDEEGRERIATRALVTAKGLVKLAALLEQPLH